MNRAPSTVLPVPRAARRHHPGLDTSAVAHDTGAQAHSRNGPARSIPEILPVSSSRTVNAKPVATDVCQDGSSGFFRAAAPPDAARDAPRFFFLESPVVRHLARRRSQPRFRAVKNCHKRFFEQRPFMKLRSVLDRSKHRRLK